MAKESERSATSRRGRWRGRWRRCTLRVEGAEEKQPYPGLESFTEADAEFFFGREVEVEAVWKKLQRPNLLAIIGPVGSGEDIVPAGGADPGASRPVGGTSVCGRDVAVRGAGAGARAGVLPATPRPAAAGADRGPRRRRSTAVRRWRRRHGAGADRRRPVRGALHAHPGPRCRPVSRICSARLALEADVHVLLVMRDDFLFHCHEHAALAPIFSELDAARAAGRRAPCAAPSSSRRCSAATGSRTSRWRTRCWRPSKASAGRCRCWPSRRRGSGSSGIESGAAHARGLRAHRRGLGRAGAARRGDARADRGGAAADRAGDVPQPRDRAGDAGRARRGGAALGVPEGNAETADEVLGAGRRAAAHVLRGRTRRGRESADRRVEIVHESLLAALAAAGALADTGRRRRATARSAPPGGAALGGEGETGGPALDRDVVPGVPGVAGALPGGLSAAEETFGAR